MQPLAVLWPSQRCEACARADPRVAGAAGRAPPQARCRRPQPPLTATTSRRLRRPSLASLRAAAASAEAPLHQPALFYDFHDRLVPYEQAWAWQKQRVDELCSPDTPDRRDTVFLLQHPPVYTLGAGSSAGHVGFDPEAPPHPLYRTERGGEVTYHGPGQLVVYPVLDLARHTQDLHWYLRGLEEVAIRALAATSGLHGKRIPGLTGVWVDGAKLAAIGIRARKWVTYHGFALNVATVLQPFEAITPCGIADRPVGSVVSALARQQGAISSSSSSASSSSSSSSSSTDLYSVGGDPLLLEYRYALVEALEQVFGLQLQPASAEARALLLAAGSSASSSQTQAQEQGLAASVA